jgi:hypothetical protein
MRQHAELLICSITQRSPESAEWQTTLLVKSTRAPTTNTKLVRRENVIAGSDCGFGTWVGQAAVDPDVLWAKMAAMA